MRLKPRGPPYLNQWAFAGTPDSAMRIAVVTDIHANLVALEAVLQHAAGERALDAVWALGDLVGYGPQPSACLARLRGLPLTAVAGNHDLAAVGAIGLRQFNPAAAAASRWTAAQLSEEDKAFLSSLPRTLVIEPFSLAHGSLRDPVWEYMITLSAALTQFDRMTTPFSLIGHTHIPLLFTESADPWQPQHALLHDGDVVELAETRLILNPGGVGQPRDGDVRAAYAVYDETERTLTFHRVPYDIVATQTAMAAAGLPESLIARLSRGR